MSSTMSDRVRKPGVSGISYRSRIRLKQSFELRGLQSPTSNTRALMSRKTVSEVF